MSTDYTFHQAVWAIDRATVTGRPFPRSLHDNVAAGPHDAGERMLLLDWPTAVERDAWLGYFGVGPPVNGVYWVDGWHGWTVILTAHRENSGAGAETSAPSPAPVNDACIEASAQRIHGLHRAADLDNAPWAMAALTPDATIQMPCGQTSRREVHGSHTPHVGAYSRFCTGWDTPTVQMAVTTR